MGTKKVNSFLGCGNSGVTPYQSTHVQRGTITEKSPDRGVVTMRQQH